MLNSVYVALTLVSFGFLLGSLLDKKIIAKAVMAGIACSIFVTLSMASFQVEVVNCDGTACKQINLNYQENAYLFYGATIVSGILSLIFSFLPFTKYFKVEVNDI